MVLATLQGRAVPRPWSDAYPELERATTLPLARVEDVSSRAEGGRLLCTLHPGSDPEQVRAMLASVPGLFIETGVTFGEPLAPLARSWVDRWRQENLNGSLQTLEAELTRRSGW